jgi:hypothetical protein
LLPVDGFGPVNIAGLGQAATFDEWLVDLHEVRSAKKERNPSFDAV